MKYALEIEVMLPRERVGELFGEAENLGAWQPGFVGLEHASGKPGKPGAKSRLTYLNGKREVVLTETIEVNNLPAEFSATYEAKGMRMAVRNRFEESGAGRTRWISENEAQVSGVLMRIIALLMPGCFKKQSFKYMENFKVFAEDGADLRKAAS
jgi:hypothetical protein